MSYNFPLLAFDFSPETCAADTILSAVYRRCFMWKSTTNLATSSAYFGRKLHPRSRSRSLKVVFFETCSAVCSESNRSKALRLCKLTFALNDFPILRFSNSIFQLQSDFIRSLESFKLKPQVETTHKQLRVLQI